METAEAWNTSLTRLDRAGGKGVQGKGGEPGHSQGQFSGAEMLLREGHQRTDKSQVSEPVLCCAGEGVGCLEWAAGV